jgi:tRNA isopentenyl-2-thiomethyl-A-37 hydroxylase MiaE
MCVGLPDDVVERARDAAQTALDNLRRSDDDARMAEDMRRMVRRELNDFWRKKPIVKVDVIRI